MKNIVLTILLICLLTFGVKAQITAIPDTSFEQALINLGYDTGVPNGNVITAAIDTITKLNVTGLNITDLTGIQDFTDLVELNCNENQLTNLDVTQNMALTKLYCSVNQLASLEISQNTGLTDLGCASNQLTSLDVSQNTTLTHLFCDRNQLISLEVIPNTALIFISCWSNELTRLDFSQNIALFYLNCDSNQLTCLNVKNGNNTNFILFTATSNPTLTCIEVDDEVWSTSNWTDIDTASSFSTNCPNNCDVGVEEGLSMKSIIFYPNPASNFITFYFNKYPVQLSLFDSQGKLVFDKSINDKLYKLSITNYKTGVYFYNVSLNGNNESGRLIVK